VPQCRQPSFQNNRQRITVQMMMVLLYVAAIMFVSNKVTHYTLTVCVCCTWCCRLSSMVHSLP